MKVLQGATMMAVTISWLIRDVVIYSRYSDVVTSADIQEANRTFDALVKDLSKEHPVHLIVDRLEVTRDTTTLSENVKASSGHEKINMGKVVIIERSNSATRVISNFIVAAIGQLLHFDYKSFDSMRGAMDYLANYDPRVSAWAKQQ